MAQALSEGKAGFRFVEMSHGVVKIVMLANLPRFRLDLHYCRD